MAVLPLSQVVSGMVLAKDVLDLSGRMLLSRSATITAKHLKIFKTWGVAEVHVMDMRDDPYPTVGSNTNPFPNTVLYGLAREEALRLFPHGNHPLNQIILAYATRAIYRRMERGEGLYDC